MKGMLKTLSLTTLSLTLLASQLHASGFGVFTQGASGLGQANAVVAHPSGPSSLYFNPALLNDVPGRQIEVGTTGIYVDRTIKLDSGGSEAGEDRWNFPGTVFYTHQLNDQVTAGLGIFFPFGLSTKWDDDYEGRYLGTSAEVFTTNINPAVSCRVNRRLSLAAGADLLYLDATLKKKINQTAVAIIAAPPAGLGPLPDIEQKFAGDGWGIGYNLGALYKATDTVSVGLAYRSHIDVNVDGKATFRGVNPLLSGQFPDTGGDADIRLPQQVAAGVAVKPTGKMVVEAGVRWEDWDSTKELKVELDRPVLGQTTDVIPRDWQSTWSYNLGGQYRLNEAVALNAGYLYGQNAVPGSTFEPLIPDTDAHLFTIGTDLTFGAWTMSGAFGYEHHEDRKKTNTLGDPAGSAVATALNGGVPTAVGTANGTYEMDIYLIAFSLGYRF
jgi:long-chain fatty acid transport protein